MASRELRPLEGGSLPGTAATRTRFSYFSAGPSPFTCQAPAFRKPFSSLLCRSQPRSPHQAGGYLSLPPAGRAGAWDTPSEMPEGKTERVFPGPGGSRRADSYLGAAAERASCVYSAAPGDRSGRTAGTVGRAQVYSGTGKLAAESDTHAPSPVAWTVLMESS